MATNASSWTPDGQIAPLDNASQPPQNLPMADSSFDIVSEINLQEMDNAITQAQKEIGTRYDFKGTAASVEFNRKEKELTLTADADSQLEAVRSVVVGKMIKRGVDPKCMDPQKLEQATHKTLRQKVKLKDGIDKDTAKTIQKQIKEMKLKVQASIQGEALRVSGAKKDDLQAVMAHLRAHPPGIPIQFNNYR
ncbi:MAG TPA: YajQ family cyclic di-GMP-binding protein [Tepidisphaeraceae bacterium]|nr:YajQ family cyclic di-GMP-binding protein [Tepidisphaeraceae bacterium]